MGKKLYGALCFLFAACMSLFGVWANTVGLVMIHPELDGVFMLLPASLAVLAALFCPVTAAVFGITIAFYIFGWPLQLCVAVFGGWITILLYWRFTRPYISVNMSLILFMKDAHRMVMGLPLLEDEMPTEISLTGGPIPARLVLSKLRERFFPS